MGSSGLTEDELLYMLTYAPPGGVPDWATYDWPLSAPDDTEPPGSTDASTPLSTEWPPPSYSVLSYPGSGHLGSPDDIVPSDTGLAGTAESMSNSSISSSPISQYIHTSPAQWD